MQAHQSPPQNSRLTFGCFDPHLGQCSAHRLGVRNRLRDRGERGAQSCRRQTQTSRSTKPPIDAEFSPVEPAAYVDIEDRQHGTVSLLAAELCCANRRSRIARLIYINGHLSWTR
jgi:hypothetical protein